MNWDTIAGNWKQYKAKIKEKWGFLTDDDLERISGKKDMLIAKIEEKYGLTRDRVERAVEEFLKRFDKAA
jgi:uncharacterized protein YjbJ (UPF0337 family)